MVGTLRFPFGVVGIGGKAESETGGVTFAAAGIELHEASGFAEQQNQDTLGERIEGAQMADLAEAGEVADRVHDVVGGFALRLVDDQSAIEGGGLGSAWQGLK